MGDLPVGQDITIRIQDASGNEVIIGTDGSLLVSDIAPLTKSGTGAALNATPITSTDISKYRGVTLRISGTFSATLVWEVSFDGGTTWDNLALMQVDTTAQAYATSTTGTNAIFGGQLAGALFRVRVSSYTSGTATVEAVFTQHPYIPVLDPNAITRVDRSTFTDGSSRGFPLMGVYNDAMTDPTSGQAAAARLTRERALMVNLRDSNGVEVEPLAASVLREGYDIFGRSKVSTDYNQVELPYDSASWTDFVDITQSGSPTGASQANGQVTITSGTGTNASYIVLSKDYTKYRMGHEVGWGGTVFFDATGLASADIWWGAADDTSLTNAVLIGWFNNTFGIRYRRGGSTISTTAQASWLDPCDGTAGSAYTLNGSPVAMDKTKCQLFRIRAGLWGYRGFIVEIAAPDPHPNGAVKWVKVIDNSLINSGTTAAFTNNNLKVGMGFTKTAAGATSVSVTASCQAGWTATDKARVSDTLTDRTLATPVIATLQGRTNAGAWVAVNVNAQGRLFVTNDSVGATGSAVPTSATLVGGTDGTNLRGLKTDTAGELEVNATTLQDKLTEAARIAGLTLSQSIASGGNYETGWVDARKIPWLNFQGSLAATGAFRADLTSSTAEDPNSPASEDFTSVASATVAGTSLGGPNNTPSFSLAGGSWVKLKLTNLTAGTESVKVVTRGSGQPGTPSILPLAAGITKDYGAALGRVVILAEKPDGTLDDIGSDENANLKTRNTPNPYSSGPNRTAVTAYLENQTADALIYTVTAGKTLYVTTLLVGVVNTATSAGRILLRDGTTAAGTGKVPFLTPPAGTGLLQSAVGPATVVVPLPEPMKFTAGVFADVLAGTLTYSVMIIGYEE